MRLYIDSADISEIKDAYEYLPVSGLTSNPSILLKSGKDPAQVLRQIRQIVDDEDDLFVQTVGSTYEEMIADGKKICDLLGMKTIIKVPSTKQGYKAMKYLVNKGYRVCATCIYHEQQALMASLIGTEFIAPYINRITLQGFDGAAKIAMMKKIMNGSSTKIMVASFKTVEQVIAAAAIEPYALTLTPDVLHKLNDMPVIDEALNKFNEDFYELVKGHKNLKDIL